MVESHVALPVRTFIDSTDQSQMPLTVKESVKKLLKTKFQDGSLLK